MKDFFKKYRVMFENIFVILLTGMFLYSGIVKILDLENFAYSVTQFDIIPFHFALLFGYMLPFVEVLAATCLFFPKTRKWGTVLIVLMLLSFIFAMIRELWKGNYYLNCGCFGPSEEDLNGSGDSVIYIISRNIVLIVFSYYFILYNSFIKTSVK